MMRFTVILIFFTLQVFSNPNYEILCNDSISKENNLTMIKKYCFKIAQEYEKKGDIANASGYYLLADKYNINIDKFSKKIPKNASGIYSNIGHSYIFANNFSEGEKYYRKFLVSYHNPNQAMQNDFKEFLKLYPKYSSQISKAKKIWDKIYKPLIGLDKLYFELNNLEQSEESIKLLEQIISIKEKYINNTLSLASDYQSLAIVYEDRFSQYNKALNLYKKMLTIFLDLLGEDFLETSTAYYNIANILNSKGKYGESLEIYKKVLNIDLKIFGENDLETASTYHNMANVYTNLNQFKKALKYYDKSLQIDLEVLGRKHENISATYQQIANIFSFQGKYDKALELYSKALKMDLQRFGENNTYVAGLYHNIANALQHKGEYIDSLEFYNKSLEIDSKLFGEHHASTVTTLENIGYVYHQIGNYDKALKIYLKALNIDLDLFGINHPHTATTYHHIAYIYQDKKMYSEALEIYNMALDIRVQVLGENDISTASTYHNIANILEDVGAYKEALFQYKRAIKIEIDRLGEENPTVANSYNNIANVKREMKKYDEALINYKKAIAINIKMLRENHPTLAINYHNIGATYFYKKDYKNAYINTKKSFDIFLKNKQINIDSLDNREKKKYLSYKQDIMRISHLFRTIWFYIKNSSFDNKLSKEAFEYWLKYKGTLFEYQNLISMIENNPRTDKKTKEHIKKLKRLTINLDNLDNNDRPPKNYKDKKLAIEEQIHNIEVNLSKQNRKFKEQLGLKNIDYKQISKALKPNQLYIDFAKGENNYYIFTLDSNNNITFKIADIYNIDSNITEFLKINKKIAKNINNHKFIEELKPKTQKILSNLYKLIITKNIKKNNKNELIISPDGRLNFLPFEALFNGKKYLVEDYTISYISSGREFIRQSKREYSKSNSKVVVFGSPSYAYVLDKNSTKDKSMGLVSVLDEIDYFEPIDSSKEIEIIKKYYSNVEIYTKDRASVENLIKIVSPKILHISTHGFFFDDINITNPMRRSALALRSANDAMFESNLRGIITALKLSSMELYGTELVVLSACETGLGTTQNAEGVIGLPKAFIQAGAKNVIMSLWSVSEQKTALLMEKFYTHVANGENYALALRNAKLEMIKKHPYYWSAFIMSGI